MRSLAAVNYQLLEVMAYEEVPGILGRDLYSPPLGGRDRDLVRSVRPEHNQGARPWAGDCLAGAGGSVKRRLGTLAHIDKNRIIAAVTDQGVAGPLPRLELIVAFAAVQEIVIAVARSQHGAAVPGI